MLICVQKSDNWFCTKINQINSTSFCKEAFYGILMTGLTFQFRIGALHRISLQRRIASGWFQKCKYFISFCKHMYLCISYVYKVLHYDRPVKRSKAGQDFQMHINIFSVCWINIGNVMTSLKIFSRYTAFSGIFQFLIPVFMLSTIYLRILLFLKVCAMCIVCIVCLCV